VSVVTKLPVPTKPKLTLANVKKGRLDVPLRVLGFGPEGVGKSTFAAGAPSPIFLGAENGTEALDIARLPEPAVWADVFESLDLLEKEKHDYKTIVIDPVNWLEPLVFFEITKGQCTIGEYQKGYGRGYEAAVDKWRVFVGALERLWLKGMNVVMLAHSQVKGFNDPENPSYDRYEISMNAKAAGLLKQWSAYVLFMRHESFAKDVGGRKAQGFSTGKRVMHTAWTAAYDAKRRFTIPDELPLSWDDFANAVANAAAQTERMRTEITELLARLNDESMSTRVKLAVQLAGDAEGKLAAIKNRLEILVNAKGDTANE